MDPKRPLYWHQGLFLQPQHFQLLDQFHLWNLEALRQSAIPYFWGVRQLNVEKAAISNRTFNLQEAQILFPDGTFVSLPGNALLNARSFEDDWIDGGRPFTVYLALRKLSQEGSNVTIMEELSDISEVSTRFVAAEQPEEARDLYGDGPDGQVRPMYYALRIFWESEKDRLGDYVYLPVAQLVRSGDEIILSPDFIPPCLTISSHEVLASAAREVRDLVAARGFQLGEYKVQRGIHSAEFGTRDMVYLLALQSLNRYTPLLYHYVEAGKVHPWQMYGTLRQLIGELSSFSEQCDVLASNEEYGAVLPSYDHWNLHECFSSALRVIARLVEEITAGPEYVIKLEFDGTYYSTELKPSMFDPSNRYYLAIKTAHDPEEVLQSLTSTAKLSSREYLPILIARALPGLPLEYQSVPPQELPRRANTLYFLIDSRNDQWAAVEQGTNIALYWDSAPEDLEAELMVVGGK